MSETTAEQKARDLLERAGVDDAQSYTAGDLVELANPIDRVAALTAENERLREELHCTHAELIGTKAAFEEEQDDRATAETRAERAEKELAFIRAHAAPADGGETPA